MAVPERLALDRDEVDLVLGRLSRRSFLADVTSFLSGPHDRLVDAARYVRAMKEQYTQRSASGSTASAAGTADSEREGG